MTSANAARFCFQLGCGDVACLPVSKLTPRSARASPASSNGPTGLSNVVYRTVLTISTSHCSFVRRFEGVRTGRAIALFELFSRAHRFHVCDAIDRQDAIEMVDLMLQEFGEIPLFTRMSFVRLPAQIRIPHGDFPMPLDRHENR